MGYVLEKEYVKKEWETEIPPEVLAGLYPERKAQVTRFKNPKAAAISCLAGALLCRAVCRELHMKPEDIRMERGEHGKPSVKGHPEFCFNLSHSGELVVLVYGDAPLGVDCEGLTTGRKDIKLAKRCFHPEEYAYILAAEGDPEEQALRFFRVWTGKESYLKYTGEGISVPLSSFCLYPEERRTLSEVSFSEYREKDYLITVCTGALEV